MFNHPSTGNRFAKKIKPTKWETQWVHRKEDSVLHADKGIKTWKWRTFPWDTRSCVVKHAYILCHYILNATSCLALIYNWFLSSGQFIETSWIGPCHEFSIISNNFTILSMSLPTWLTDNVVITEPTVSVEPMYCLNFHFEFLKWSHILFWNQNVKIFQWSHSNPNFAYQAASCALTWTDRFLRSITCYKRWERGD